MPDAPITRAEAAAAFASFRRPPQTYTCVMCGQPFVAQARDRQQPQTCSNRCRTALRYRRKKEREKAADSPSPY